MNLENQTGVDTLAVPLSVARVVIIDRLDRESLDPAAEKRASLDVHAPSTSSATPRSAPTCSARPAS